MDIGRSMAWTRRRDSGCKRCYLFRQKDAEDAKVQWIASSLGQYFATIGGDNKFKLWQEDSSQLAGQGRRFKCFFAQSPPNHVSYVCFGSTTVDNDIVLCLMTHDGLLSLLEPVDPETLKSWSQIDSFYPFGQCPRGTEARFSLSFGHSESSNNNATYTGDDAKTLSLAVSAMNSIKIFHATRPNDHSQGNAQLCEILTMHTDTVQINEVAWAPGCLRSCGVIAAACDDGTIRIFEVDVRDDSDGTSSGLAAKSPHLNGQSSASPADQRNVPSGIGAGLAGMSRHTPARRDSSNRMKHESREAGVLTHGDGAPVWKVRWIYDGLSYSSIFSWRVMLLISYTGSALASTGDNGKVHLWRESLGGKYIEFAETEPA